MADFEDRSGIVHCSTEWGRWYQTVSDVNIEVDLQQGTKGRDVKVDIRPSRVSCTLRGSIIFQGQLFGKVIEDDSTWTLEDSKLLRILLVKVKKDEYWSSLLENGGYQPDPQTLLQMRQKLDLERFELDNPGFDFSSARLDKRYEDMDPLHQLGAASLPAMTGGDNKTDDEKLMETAMQEVNITSEVNRVNFTSEVNRVNLTSEVNSVSAVRTDDMKTDPAESVQSTTAVRTDDMKTNPSARPSEILTPAAAVLEPIVTDDMKTEENESLETDEEKSGV